MKTDLKSILSKLRTAPWIVAVIVAVFVATTMPIFPNGMGGYGTLVGFVYSWIGTIFKAISAAIVGFYFCKHVMKLNLSEIEDPVARGIAGLGASVIIASFVIGVSKGL